LKLLKEWDIASRFLFNIKSNIGFASIYLKEIFIIYPVLILLFVFTQDFLSYILFLIIALLTIFFLYFLFKIGGKRKKEINNIKEIINKIYNNEYSAPDEIRLGKDLIELEGDIKAMFLKSRNDIDNLKKLELVRTQFLANVSHELRTPIFAIQGYLETLRDGAINDSKVNKGFLNKAISRTLNLNDLLSDLIDISMIESGEMRLSFRYFNLSEFLQSIVADMSLIAEEKDLQLKLLDTDKNVKVFGDKKRLKQVLVNLIQNSIKYTEYGKIEIEVVNKKDFAYILVRDTGIGIAEKDLGRIFERFYRVDKDRSRAIGGTGLGLAIVKHIIEAHGSKISVKSIVGKGTEFSFSLKI